MRHTGWQRGRTWLLGFLVAGLPGMAAASAPSEYRYVAVMGGECERLILADRDRTAGCGDKLVNVDYGDGRVAFAFTSPADHGTVVTTFLGRASAQKDLRNYRLDVDEISTTTNAAGDPASIVESAAGHCVMTGDPTRERARFECTAERRSGGRATATFVSAGVPTVYAGARGDTRETAAVTPAR